MCEILYMNYDKHGATSGLDLQCYKRNMPVVVQDDGFAWNKNERSDSYYIKKLPGINKNHPDILSLFESVTQTLPMPQWMKDMPFAVAPTKLIRRRKRQLDRDVWTKQDDDFLGDTKQTEFDRLARLHSKHIDLTVQIND